jgi:selenocysteine-specific translation elongation factor
MPVLNIAAVMSDDLARNVAKPSDQRDVHTYVHKETGPEGARILSIIRPAKFPERLRPLLNALSVGRVGLIEVNAINAALGETLVAFASAGIARGLAVIRNPEGGWIDEHQVRSLFSQAGLEQWTFESDDGIHLREKLYALMDELKESLAQEARRGLVLPVDQHFNVRGIGLVAIGYVQAGTVKQHDEILMLPAKGGGTAKSLQVMDDDVSMASAGDRVGLALRNAQESHLTGGTIIVHPPIDDARTNTHRPAALEAHASSNVDLTPSPFQRRALQVGDVVHVSVDLQFVVGRVVDGEGRSLVVEWEHPVLVRTESPPTAVIAQLDSNPRIVGAARLERRA